MILRRWRWKIAQFFELFWWKNYLRKKDKAAYLEWKMNYWEGFLKKLGIVVPQGARCLDAGCGPAGIFIYLEGRELYAVDPLLTSYESSTVCFSREDHPAVRFFPVPIEEFAVEEPFDFIFCLNALNHFEDLQSSLRVIFSHAHEASLIVISVDCHRFTFFKHLFRIFQGDLLHPHQHSRGEYERMIQGFGGRIEKRVLIKRTAFFDYYGLCVRLA